MGLTTPLDKFDAWGEEFPDFSAYTDEDLITMHDMIVDEISQRGKREPCQ